MDREATRTLIEQAYRKRDAGDLEGTVAAFHPAGRLEIVGSKAHAGAAVVAEGHAQLRATLTNYIAAFGFIRRDFISVIIEGDRAAVHCRVTLRFVPKDQTVTTDLVDLFKLEDGKIIELLEFVDTATINDLMR
jgi:ketosteroid isomerase-like protein